jgi:hypothetical protein
MPTIGVPLVTEDVHAALKEHRQPDPADYARRLSELPGDWTATDRSPSPAASAPVCEVKTAGPSGPVAVPARSHRPHAHVEVVRDQARRLRLCGLLSMART